ncbi:hypothetical protein [Micromonospora sp. KC723]|nr:hypothetical protein [Micromonospora sp. KC723]
MADLRQACALVLDEVERRFGREISLSAVRAGYYWNVDFRAAFR